MNAIIFFSIVVAVVVSKSYGAPTHEADLTIPKWKGEIRLTQNLQVTQNVNWTVVEELVEDIKTALPQPYRDIATIARAENVAIGNTMETKLTTFYGQSVGPLIPQLDELVRNQSLTTVLVDDYIFRFTLAIALGPVIAWDEYQQLSVSTQAAIDVRVTAGVTEVHDMGVELLNLLR